jgi:hypothetical protein
MLRLGGSGPGYRNIPGPSWEVSGAAFFKKVARFPQNVV